MNFEDATRFPDFETGASSVGRESHGHERTTTIVNGDGKSEPNPELRSLIKHLPLRDRSESRWYVRSPAEGLGSMNRL
jgi:hypothetical protein